MKTATSLFLISERQQRLKNEQDHQDRVPACVGDQDDYLQHKLDVSPTKTPSRQIETKDKSARIDRDIIFRSAEIARSTNLPQSIKGLRDFKNPCSVICNVQRSLRTSVK